MSLNTSWAVRCILYCTVFWNKVYLKFKWDLNVMYVRFQKIFISYKCELLFPLPFFIFEGWSVQLGKECWTYNSNLFLAIAKKAGTLGKRFCELQWISSLLPIPECLELMWWPCQVTLRCLPWSADVSTWHFPFGGYILPISVWWLVILKRNVTSAFLWRCWNSLSLSAWLESASWGIAMAVWVGFRLCKVVHYLATIDVVA